MAQNICEEAIAAKQKEKQNMIKAAMGEKRAKTVLKNATYINVFSNEMLTCDIAIEEGRIVGLGDYQGENEIDLTGKIVCPGFIDAHIHLESSLVSPIEFVKATLPHGTTTVITDPHEITNVMGTDGIDYMLEATEGLPIDVRLMLPSCVPATPMDEAGAVLEYKDIDSYYENRRVLGLAEVMNAYGVIHTDPIVISKIAAAQVHHKKIDGHAPALTGKELNAYISAGVYSDHECSTLEEATEKIRAGQYIMIREGTAACNLKALSPLLKTESAERCMFCTDDKHPNDLLEVGHLDAIIRAAITKHGVNPMTAVKAASFYPARYFKLNDRGAVAPGYLADLVVVDSLQSFKVEMVFKKGELFYNDGTLKDFPSPTVNSCLLEKVHDTFHVKTLTAADFEIKEPQGVIGMIPSELVTKDMGSAEGIDTEKDLLKIAVIERHKMTGHIGLGFINGYGLKSGAVATSVSHDSHNIIVVGTNECDMAFAVNKVVENHGGIVVAENERVTGNVVLNIAGIMSDRTLYEVNDSLENAKKAAYTQGVSRDIDPFMSLSFMSLPVIPEIKITTRGIVRV